MRTAGMLLLAVLPGCTGAADKPELMVFAASSLTEAFRDLATEFEAAQSERRVVVNTAGSQTLRVQLEQGAPADVFASANVEHMAALVEGGHVRSSRPFANNHLVLVVPDENPAGLGSFVDLPRAERLVLGTDEAPVGAYAMHALRSADAALGDGFYGKVESRIVSRETSTRHVLAKVQLGEADAGIVYASDALTSEGVEVIEVPAAYAPAVAYHIGIVSRSRVPRFAADWIDFVVSSAGRAGLARHGFSVAGSL